MEPGSALTGCRAFAFFFQAEDGIRDLSVTGVQTCALPISMIHENWGLHLLERKPSEYLTERNYWGTLHDPVGIQRREVLGPDKILWASDFAHAASDWPRSEERRVGKGCSARWGRTH